MGTRGARRKGARRQGRRVRWPKFVSWYVILTKTRTSIKTKKGNEVTRKGDEEDPAVVIDTGKNKAIKKSHELTEK